MEAQTRAFFGDKWYDLPGNDDELGRAEAAYLRGVQKAFANYRAAQKAKQKPKLKGKGHKQKHRSEKERKKRAEQHRRDGLKIDKSEDKPQQPVPAPVPEPERPGDKLSDCVKKLKSGHIYKPASRLSRH